jgi:hypothetical protein
MSRGFSVFAGALVGLTVGVTVTSGQAAPVTLVGTDIDVTYDDAAGWLALYGTPTVTGNNILFTPSGFDAESLDGAGLQQTSSTLELRIDAHAGMSFVSLFVLERGDYKLDGAGSSVSVAGTLGIDDTATSGATASDSSALSSTSDFSINDNALHLWDASANVAMVDPEWDGITSVDVSFSNTLSADSASNPSTAFIEKKFLGGATQLMVDMGGGTAIPEPSAVFLVGSALVGILGLARKGVLKG